MIAGSSVRNCGTSALRAAIPSHGMSEHELVSQKRLTDQLRELGGFMSQHGIERPDVDGCAFDRERTEP